MSLHHLLYISEAADGVGSETLESIHRQSQRNNPRLGVTGVLFYSAGNFVQLLEGESDIIDALFERIQHDPRHTNVQLLCQRPIDRRIFNHWAMGVLNLDDRLELDRQQLQELIMLAPVEKKLPITLDILSRFCMMLPRPDTSAATV